MAKSTLSVVERYATPPLVPMLANSSRHGKTIAFLFTDRIESWFKNCCCLVSVQYSGFFPRLVTLTHCVTLRLSQQLCPKSVASKVCLMDANQFVLFSIEMG